MQRTELTLPSFAKSIICFELDRLNRGAKQLHVNLKRSKTFQGPAQASISRIRSVRWPSFILSIYPLTILLITSSSWRTAPRYCASSIAFTEGYLPTGSCLKFLLSNIVLVTIDIRMNYHKYKNYSFTGIRPKLHRSCFNIRDVDFKNTRVAWYAIDNLRNKIMFDIIWDERSI